jgi:hypothetical protein
MRNAASDNFNGESEPLAIPFYYWLQSDAAGDVTFTVYQGNVPIATVTGAGEAGMHMVSWGMNKMPQGQPQAAAQGAAARFQGRGARGQPAPIGEYTVVMSVAGQEMSRTVSILKDEWWMARK